MDLLILLQTFLYFLIFVAGFFVCIPVGVNRSRFDGLCILYADVNQWRHITSSPSANCDFPIYFGVFGMILIGLFAGLCFGYFALKSREDRDVGSQCWMLPFIPLNAVLAVFTLVVACILSVGFKVFCDSADKIRGCAQLEYNLIDGKTNTGAFIDLASLSQAGAWIGFFLYAIQTGISILRFLRNRKLKTEEKVSKSPTQTFL